MCFFLGTAIAQNPTDALFNAFQPAPSQRFYLDLDTAEGKYSQWSTDDVGTLNAIRASLVVKRLATHAHWMPSFVLALGKNAPDRLGQLSNSVSLQISSPDRHPPLELRIVRYDNGYKTVDEKLDKTLEVNEKLEVELFFAMPDTIVLNLGSAGVRKVKVPWKPGSVIVTGSTCEVMIDPLELGTVNP
ncbi:MAG: hypothetical protein WA628_25065 [Terriglobales bacterium]